MDPRQVLIKTAKGQEEIQTRTFKLAARPRRFLIMVDGQSTLGETLTRLAAHGDDAADLLKGLVADGFLAPRDGAPMAAPTNAAPAKTTAVAEQAEFNLDKAKGFARYIVLGNLGPVGARRAERIDAAGSAADLRVELVDLHDTLPKLLSKRQAKQMWEQLEPLLLSIDELGV